MDIRKFWVDIEDGSGNRYGDGPLRARVFRVKKPLSESGDFAFDILGGDPNIGALQIKRVAICRYIDANGSTQTLGGGIIDKIVAQLDPSGLLVYQVSGNDLTRELFYRSVGSLKLESAGVGVTNGPDLIMAYAPAGWTINSGSTSSPVYLGFAGESVLAALIKCAENAGEHWRLGSGREIDWIGLPASFVSSGVRAVQHLNDAISAESLASLAVVMAMSETHDSAEVLSRVIPIGAGIGGAATTLANATDPAPSGYTLDTVNNYLKQNAAEAAYGRIEKSIEFKNLGPLGSTVTDAASASNALLQAAYQHLERFKAPAKFYDVSIWTNAVLEPGQTIQIIYRKLIDSAVVFDLNDEFIVLSVEQTIDEQGLSTTKMMVATIDRKPATDADVMLDELQQSNNLQTNRQQLLAGDIVGLNVVIGSGTPGHVAQWDSGGSTLEDSTLIKSGAGLLTLAATNNYTMTVAGTASISGTNTGDQDLTPYLKLDASNDPITGALLVQLGANSTTAFQVNLAAGGTTPTLNVDTTNQRVGIGTNAPGEVLHVKGSGNIKAQVESSLNSGYAFYRLKNDSITADFGLYGSTKTGTVFGQTAANLFVVYASSDVMALGTLASKALHLGTNNTTRLTVGASGGLTINDGLIVNEDGGAAADFRVEGDTESNLIFADASADTVYLGGSPNGASVVKGGTIKSKGDQLAVVTKTADYTAAANDEVIVCNKTTAMTITLPAATGSGQTYSIKNINTGAVTIDGNSADTIDGALTQIIYQWEGIRVHDYAANAWVVI